MFLCIPMRAWVLYRNILWLKLLTRNFQFLLLIHNLIIGDKRLEHQIQDRQGTTVTLKLNSKKGIQAS